MNRPVLIVFTRIPRLGIGKRRLARRIGDRAALTLSRAILHNLLHRLRGLRGVARVIAATPDHHAKLTAPGWMILPQGEGDLGRRMRRAFRRFQHRPAVLIGSDIPGIGAGDIRTALRLLRGHHAVFGPAEDGGYWLIGLSSRRPDALFSEVRWSTPDALADTIRSLPGSRIALLRRLFDIDDAVPP
ncbi:TIGR04282 family arsenosugar biosynthesis glycosyltransferase, partial [Acidiphilium sp.]|uniref:TIGR04282 family arsenosugar biosynthesis glycosyltransferase n=1 Tax=Acidiphilium sp. TaxID=527 RepID=UPI003D08DC5E